MLTSQPPAAAALLRHKVGMADPSAFALMNNCDEDT